MNEGTDQSLTPLVVPFAEAILGKPSTLSLFDLSPTPMWGYDQETRCLNIVNEVALRSYCYSREQFLALTLDKLLPPEAQPQFVEANAGEQPSRACLRRANGTFVDVELTATQIEFAGRPSCLVAANDTSREFRREDAVVESRHGEQQFLEASFDWFWAADAKGRLKYISPNFEAYHGSRIAEILGKRLSEVPGVNIAPEVAEKARMAVQARQPFYDYIYSHQLHPGDRRRWVHTNSIPIFGDMGEISGFRGASRDITAQVEAEEALRQSEARFRRLYEISADFYWEHDVEHRLTFMSPASAADTLYGVPLSQLLGKRTMEVLATRFEPAMGLRAAAAANARQPYRDVVFSATHTNGEVRWVSVCGAPRFGADGEFLGYHGTGVEITERKEAEAAAQLAQGRLHAAVERLTQPFVVFDAEDRAVAFNQAFADLFRTPSRNTPVYRGISNRELAAWQVQAEFYAHEPEEPPVDVETLLARCQTEDEHTYHLSDGRWMLVVHHRLPNEGRVGLWTDVTSVVVAQKALRNSEERFRRLFEIGADYYWEQDAQHRVTFASPESVHDAIYGIPLAQLVGKRIAENLAVKFDSAMGTKALSAFKARQPFRDVVFSVKHPDGQLRWVSLTGAPRFGTNGEFLGYQGSGVEITARVEDQAVAQLAQRRLHDAVAHVTQPFVVFDADDRAVAFNQAFADLFRTPTRNTPVHSGISFRELAEWEVRTDFCASGQDEVAVDFETLLSHHQTETEHTYHLSDGRWMLVTHRGLPGGARVGLWTDVTAIKRAEAERRDLELQLHNSRRLEAVGTLAGGIAHELNNALVPVITLTKLVARTLSDGTRERRNLDAVLDAATRSRDLVDQILAFSRKEGEQRSQRVDLGQLLRESLAAMRATVPTRIRVEETIAPTPPLEADPEQLQQVIANLLTNAAQAIGETIGTIAVRLEPSADGAYLRLSVSDNGCGMDAVTKARMFEPFFTTREVGKGTGLGLAVAHGIISRHGGRIQVESAPGRGARFDVVLPVLPAVAESANSG